MRLIATTVLVATACLLLGNSSRNPKPGQTAGEGPPVLWRDPADLGSRNLYYGPGGKSHEPHGALTFIKEDTAAASPKFEAVDQDGIHWKVKLGIEARGETAATRLVWAAGYFANEDYFVPEVQVNNLPHLHRGNHFVSKGGIVHDVRLKRHSPGEKKLGSWSWSDNPFRGTRQWNGLRVMMALINNWDLKDINNSIYQIGGAAPEQHYMVSDLGASLGTTNLNRGMKGDLRSYEESKWINSVSGDPVDFNVPSPPPAGYALLLPIMVQRMDLVWIGRGIPRADARWLGDMLGRLSSQQIRDAFRAANYSADEVERFSRVVERRIRELQAL